MNWAIVLVGTALAGTSFLGAIGVLKPNGLVGVRTTATRRNEKAWRAGHAKSATVMVPVGLCLIVIGVGNFLSWPILGDLTRPVGSIVIGLAVVASFLSVRMANRAANSA